MAESGRPRINGSIRLRDEWGRLECIGLDVVRVRLAVGGGGTAWERETYLKILRCHGGGVGCRGDFNILDGVEQGWTVDGEYNQELFPIVFPGKRLMRDCGCKSRLPTVEEMVNRAGEAQDQDHSVSMSVLLPAKTRDEVKEYARQAKDTAASVYRQCLRAGREVLDGDSGARLGSWVPKRGEKRVLVQVRVSKAVKAALDELAAGEGRAVGAVVIALIGLGLSELKKVEN